MKTSSKVAIVVASVLVLVVAFFSLRGFTTTVELSKDDLQSRVEKFVSENGQIGSTLEFTNPKVMLEEEGNRVGLEVDVWASAYGKEGSGSLTASGSLTYKPEDGTFYISELKISKISIDKVPQFAMGMVTSFVQDGLNKLMPSIGVYTLKEGDLKQRAAKLMLQKVEVKPGKVVATIGY